MVNKMDRQPPLFSILIVCWNNRQTISACLEALCSQTIQDFEVILVDNGSTEPIPADLPSRYPQLTIQFFTLAHNTGFAQGNNYAAEKASADTLILLNADAFPAQGWLEAIRKGIHDHPGCFYTSRLVMAEAPERMDGMGDVYHASGLAWRRDHYKLANSEHDHEREVFSACGAAAVYPAEAYRQAKGFDEDYFAYQEDVDLGFRLQLMGYRCIYLPQAVVRHVGSASTSDRSDFSVYYGQRNLVWTFFKDMPGVFVWLLWPYHLLANALMIMVGLTRGQGRLTLQAKWDALLKLPFVLRKRRQVQKTRKASLFQVLRRMDWSPVSPFSKLLNSSRRLRK